MRAPLHAVLAEVRKHFAGLRQVREQLQVQVLVAQTAIEGLAVRVLPRSPRFDLRGLGPAFREPRPLLPRDETRPVAHAQVPRRPARFAHPTPSRSLRITSSVVRLLRSIRGSS